MPDIAAFLAGGGQMGSLIRDHDWSSTPLGPIGAWPQSLRSALSICLRSTNPTAIFWGPDHLYLYNDCWAERVSAAHPHVLGRNAAEAMPDIWPALKDQFRTAFEQARSVTMTDTLLVRSRDGGTVDTYWSYSILPIASEDGTIGGLLGQATETTARVVRARQDAFVLLLSERLRLLDEPDAILETALDLLNREVVASRVGYAEVDEEQGTISILRCASRGSAADLSGTYSIERVGPDFHEALRTGAPIRMDDLEADPRMADAELRDRYRRVGIGSAMVVPIVSGERYRALLFAHEPGPRHWVAHDEDLLRTATHHIWREVSRARAEAALRHSEERYRRIFEQANDLIVTADLDQIITDCNPAAAAVMGTSREDLIGTSIARWVSDSGYDQTSRMLQHKLEHGGTTRHDLEVISPMGKRLYWEVNSTLALDPSGKPIGLHAIARDVTERKEAEERQRLLVNELNHRVKNTLALVQGLALQSFGKGNDPADALVAFQQRLSALAAAHDLLTRENWEGGTLARLIEQAVGHHNSIDERIAVAGPEIVLSPKAAISFVMAMHELATNAAKYGALSAPSGRVTVSWGTEPGGRLWLEWRERGGPEVSAPDRKGFGLRMIERALATDIGGSVSLDFDPRGIVCRIDASLAEATRRKEAP